MIKLIKLTKKAKPTKTLKTLAKIDGMACSMCEAHVNDAIRRTFDGNVKKVTSSHRKGSAEIISIEPIDRAALGAALASLGYKLVDLVNIEN